jgi:murein DD-endopeptidase MepM/ murein hydrolase activator NlpD
VVARSICRSRSGAAPRRTPRSSPIWAGRAPDAHSPSAGPPQSAAEGAVFPVAGAHNFGGPENAFGAPREGYSHQGQDILTEEGTPVLAPYAGTIESTSYQEGGAGYYAVEHTTVGFDFFFAHCEAGSLAVSAEQQVSAGQLLCRAGQTGDATTPHLDFEIWLQGWRTAHGYPINPLPYLEAWERR